MHTHMQNINSLNKFKGMFCKMKIGLKSCSKCCTFFQNSVPLIFLFLPANFILPSICTMTGGGKSFSTVLPHQLTYTQLRHWQCWLMWNFVFDHQNECWGPQDCLGITRRMLFDPSKLLLVFIHKSFALSSPPSLFPIPLQPQLSTSL